MQLGDLLPHLSRLVPIMERALSSNRPDPAGAELINEFKAGIADLNDSQASILSHLHEQTLHLGMVEEEVRLAREAAMRSDQKLAVLEKRLARVNNWALIASIVIAILLLAILFLVVRIASHS